MTPDAISRRTNVPEEMVLHALAELMKPDLKSRSPLESGARLVPLDSHRDWGWQIVNFDHYRAIRDEESRKTYFRDYKREYRQSKKSTKRPQLSTIVLDCPTKSTEEEEEAEIEVEIEPPKKPCGISPEMLARGLAENLGISLGYGPTSFNTAATEVARAEEKAGRNLVDVAVEMEAAFRFYEQEKPNLRITWGPANFIGDGHWRNPDSWPRKAKSRSEEIADWKPSND